MRRFMFVFPYGRICTTFQTHDVTGSFWKQLRFWAPYRRPLGCLIFDTHIACHITLPTVIKVGILNPCRAGQICTDRPRHSPRQQSFCTSILGTSINNNIYLSSICSKYIEIKTNNKKVSHRKQIARQHSCQWRRRGRTGKIFLSSSLIMQNLATVCQTVCAYVDGPNYFNRVLLPAPCERGLTSDRSCHAALVAVDQTVWTL